MSVPTDPRQPIVYDMMLLADSLLKLRDLKNARQEALMFCERQKNLEVSLSKIRNLAQFISPRKGSDLIKITDPEFGGKVERTFTRMNSDSVSKYVSHPHEQRWKKEKKYPRLTAGDADKSGKEILNYLKPLMDSLYPKYNSVTKTWYNDFCSKYKKL